MFLDLRYAIEKNYIGFILKELSGVNYLYSTLPFLEGAIHLTFQS